MKALLRVILLLDAALQVMVGLILLLSPVASIFTALQLPQPGPALYGQLLGVLLIGSAWLLARAAINGHLTVPVASVTGNVNLACAILIIVWLVFFELPVTGAGRIWLPILAAVMALFAAVEIPAASAIVRKEKARKEIARHDAGTDTDSLHQPESSHPAKPIPSDPYRRDPVLVPNASTETTDRPLPDHARQNPHP